MLRRLLALPIFSLLVAHGAAAQSPPDDDPFESGSVQVEIGEGRVMSVVRMAFPEPTITADAELAAAARGGGEALRDDLFYSRIFDIQGPRELSVLQLTGEPARDFELYRSLGSQVLLEVDFKAEDGRLVLEGRLWQLEGGEPILGKRYRGDAAAARRIAHTFADEIIQYFSGRPGVSRTSIAFYSDRTGPRPNQIKEIFIMDYDGQNQRPVTAHQTISLSPEWSPSGDAIAYTSYFSGRPGLYLVQLPSGAKTGVVTDGSLNVNPSFSPDGRRIAFTRSLGDGNPEIFVCNRDGSDLRRLTHSSGIDTNPAWSPNGRSIAFTSSRGGSPQIYTMDAEGANLRRVTRSGSYNDGAAWSPDGTFLAYATRQGGNRFDIVVVDLRSLETRTITSGPASNESPSFSPDGRRIAFARASGSGPGATQIFIMDVDGANLRQLTREGTNWGPSWSGYPPN